jgi:hypothetical protein
MELKHSLNKNEKGWWKAKKRKGIVDLKVYFLLEMATKNKGFVRVNFSKISGTSQELVKFES